MEAIVDSISQLTKDVEQLEELNAKKKEILDLQAQNQKLKYRLDFLNKVNSTVLDS